MKIALLAFALILTSSVATGQGTNANRVAGSWMTDQNGCKVFVVTPPKAITWSGKCSNGYAEGYGMLKSTFSDNTAEWTGKMLSGKRNGKGVTISSKGYRYEGDFKDGVAHGHGIETYSSPHPEAGMRFEGQFKDGYKWEGPVTYSPPHPMAGKRQ